jgi:mannitol-1-phosphate 5-dehydrogenase
MTSSDTPQRPSARRSYLGFGFGPIQAGLFLYEAQRSGSFQELAVAEVIPKIVDILRAAGGEFWLNIAHADRVESVDVGPVEVLDPAVDADRERLIELAATSSDIATAVPSVAYYRTDRPGSIHRILAQGLAQRAAGSTTFLYAAENHNHAAEVLRDAVLEECALADLDAPPQHGMLRGCHFLNTVIGKMSCVVSDPEEIARRGLKTVTAQSTSAFLVEAFRRILVTRPRLEPGSAAAPGFTAFEAKDDLLPFEEAKLYGHNAVHALAAYLAAHRGLKRIDELSLVRGAARFLHAALVEEAGAGLSHRHRGVDPLFSQAGFEAYAADLIPRMLNPHLGDPVARVARDPERKLGWDDRLTCTMRLALEAGVAPRRFALGVAAALRFLDPQSLDDPRRRLRRLEAIWSREPDPEIADPRRGEVLSLVAAAMERLREDPVESVFESL